MKQATIKMIDGSRLLYNIDITIQTENRELSHAYQNIKTQSTAELMEPIELLLVERLRKFDPDNEPKTHGTAIELTADDYPESAE